MQAAALANRRASERRLVQRSAECRLGGSHLPGEVRDESRGGVFFAFSDGDSTPGDAHLRYEPELGDAVMLAYADGDRTVATVRWRGHSSEHGCLGLGLQFDEL